MTTEIKIKDVIKCIQSRNVDASTKEMKHLLRKYLKHPKDDFKLSHLPFASVQLLRFTDPKMYMKIIKMDKEWQSRIDKKCIQYSLDQLQLPYKLDDFEYGYSSPYEIYRVCHFASKFKNTKTDVGFVDSQNQPIGWYLKKGRDEDEYFKYNLFGEKTLCITVQNSVIKEMKIFNENGYEYYRFDGSMVDVKGQVGKKEIRVGDWYHYDEGKLWLVIHFENGVPIKRKYFEL